jgi:hypothetical protein
MLYDSITNEVPRNVIKNITLRRINLKDDHIQNPEGVNYENTNAL